MCVGAAAPVLAPAATVVLVTVEVLLEESILLVLFLISFLSVAVVFEVALVVEVVLGPGYSGFRVYGARGAVVEGAAVLAAGAALLLESVLSLVADVVGRR